MTVSVFVGGQDGFGSYRIPALLKTSRDTLLAFCEGRRFHSDHAQNTIVLRRSQDQGATWGHLSVIAEAGHDSLNNPLVVEDSADGEIMVMYQRYPFTREDDVDDPLRWRSHAGQDFPPNIHEGAAQPGYEGNICRTFLQRSDDDGLSWSEAHEITRQVKREPYVTSVASGPGIGIQLTRGRYAGRLVMPFTQGPWDAMGVYTVFSDDRGAHWRKGEIAPSRAAEFANEVQVAELGNGDLLLNARSFKGNKRRKIARSRDGGESWTPLEDAADLVEPECQGSMIAFVRNHGESVALMYCGPSDSEQRRQGSLFQSSDGARSWHRVAVVNDGFFAYSSIGQLGRNQMGVLYECDDYGRIAFQRVRIA